MQIVFLFYQGMTALDAIGPHEILSRLPNAKVLRVAENRGAIHTDSGLIITADLSLSEVSYGDVLLIPGAGNATTLRDSPKTLDWIRAIHATTTWTTSVCTGSLILGAAGVLEGKRATSHWAALDRLSTWGADPIEARIVEDGKIVTAAGVSAGIDMALLLTSKIAGRTFAEAMTLGIEYDPEPPYDVGSPAKADPEICNALRKQMVASFEKR